MACVVNFICKKCHKESWESRSNSFHSAYSDICSNCFEKERVNAREKHLLRLKALTLEERMSTIEAWIYDLKPERNINEIKYG